MCLIGKNILCYLSLCCECGIPISPNPANICVACLRSKVDISQGIPKQVSISFCKQCQRYGALLCYVTQSWHVCGKAANNSKGKACGHLEYPQGVFRQFIENVYYQALIFYNSSAQTFWSTHIYLTAFIAYLVLYSALIPL